MRRLDTSLGGLCVIEPVVHGDHRGFFMECFNREAFASMGIRRNWVQDNHSRSTRGVLRGLHYQIRQPQAKLVRVIAGRVMDVAVDVRVGSPTFGQYRSFSLSAENKKMLFIPEGFAHGFYVLSDVAEFIYKCSDFYAPRHERGVAWDDPQIGIDWPLDGRAPILSDKDASYGRLAELDDEDLPAFEEGRP